MDSDSELQPKVCEPTYNDRMFDFIRKQAPLVKDKPSNKAWIEAQLKRTARMSSNLYLWSESLRQKGGTLEDASTAISELQDKIYGVKDLIDGKDFSEAEINGHKVLEQQGDDQTINEFYDAMQTKIKKDYSEFDIEEAAPKYQTILTDLRILRGLKVDIDSGNIQSVTQLRDNLFELSGVDLVAETYFTSLEYSNVDASAEVLNKSQQAQQGLVRLGSMIGLSTEVKRRELWYRIQAAEKGTPLLPGDDESQTLLTLRKDLEKFTPKN